MCVLLSPNNKHGALFPRRLVYHLQMVEQLGSAFGGQKGDLNEPLEPPLTLPTGLHHSHERIYQALSTFAVFVFQSSGALGMRQGVFTRPLNMQSVTTVSVFVCQMTYVTHYDTTQEVSGYMYCGCGCSLGIYAEHAMYKHERRNWHVMVGNAYISCDLHKGV